MLGASSTQMFCLGWQVAPGESTALRPQRHPPGQALVTKCLQDNETAFISICFSLRSCFNQQLKLNRTGLKGKHFSQLSHQLY